MSHEDLRSLEEQLAQRLYSLTKGSSGDMRSWPSVGHEIRAPYLIMAAECLRQMEWSRRGPTNLELDRRAKPGPIILAPAGWTP